MTTQHIAYNIKFFREQHGWTQEDLAKKVLSSRSKVAKWENNSIVPDIESLMQLSDLFDITLDHLVGRQSFQKDLLTDFKRIYQLNTPSYDEDVVQLIEYVLQYPLFKESLLQLQDLPIHKQQSLHQLVKILIKEYEQL